MCPCSIIQRFQYHLLSVAWSKERCRESGKNKECAKHRKDLNSRRTQDASKQYKGINNDLKHLQIRGKVKKWWKIKITFKGLKKGVTKMQL